MLDNINPTSEDKTDALKTAFAKAKPKAAAQVKKDLAKGTTKAKTATVPAKTAKALAKTTAQAEAANAKWERPNLNALCRKMAGGDIMAGVLLFHILYVWNNRTHKQDWLGKDWLYHSREAWATAAGLSFDEFKKRALPRIKKYCHEFLIIRQRGNGPHKRLWVHLDEIAFREAVSESLPWDMFDAALNGIGPGNQKQPSNAYAE